MRRQDEFDSNARQRCGNLGIAQSCVAQLHEDLPPETTQRGRSFNCLGNATRLRLGVLFDQVEQLKGNRICLWARSGNCTGQDGCPVQGNSA